MTNCVAAYPFRDFVIYQQYEGRVWECEYSPAEGSRATIYYTFKCYKLASMIYMYNVIKKSGNIMPAFVNLLLPNRLRTYEGLNPFFLSKRAVKLVMLSSKSYICETGFSTLAAIKAKCHNGLNVEVFRLPTSP